MTRRTYLMLRPARREQVSLVQAHDPIRWDRAGVASGQPTTPFHDYRWLVLAAAMTESTFVPLVVTRDGEDVGVAPLMLRRRGPVSLLNWVPFPYLGPLVERMALGQTLDALRGWTARNGVVRQQQSFPPGASIDLDALSSRGFSCHRDPTYVVEIRDSEERQSAALESRGRGAIRKAESSGLHIRAASDSFVLGEVVRAAFRAQGTESGYRGRFPPSPADLSTLTFPVRHVVAELEGRAVGTLVSFARRGRVFVWLGGVLPAFRPTQANTLLYWDALQWARRLGANSVDLVGLPTAGIAHFKRQFGGVLNEYAVSRRTSAVGRVLETGRERLARFP